MSTLALEKPLNVSRVLSLLAIVFSLLGVLSTPASAAGLPLKDVHGVLSDGGRFDGTVQVRSFELVEVGDGFVIAVHGLLRAPRRSAMGPNSRSGKGSPHR